jgi:predicted helicase
MELKLFIKSSLTQIMEAIHESQVEWNQNHPGKGAINPAWDSTNRLRDHTQNVEFDVAVTVENSQSGNAGAGIKIFSASVGLSGEIAAGNSTVSRIKFIVPVVPPVQIIIGGDVSPPLSGSASYG